MSNPLLHKRLAVLGAGKMGGILLRAFLDQKLVAPGHVSATVRHPERAEKLAKALGVRIGSDNAAAVRGADVVLLAVKPMQMAEVLQEIRGELKAGSGGGLRGGFGAHEIHRAASGQPGRRGAGHAQYAVRHRRRDDGHRARQPRHRGARGVGARPCSRPWGAWWCWTKSTWTR